MRRSLACRHGLRSASPSSARAWSRRRAPMPASTSGSAISGRRRRRRASRAASMTPPSRASRPTRKCWRRRASSRNSRSRSGNMCRRASPRSASPAGATCSSATARCSTRSKAATASTATSSSPSGAWNPIYGEVLSDPKIVKGVVRSLATLAYADRRRAKFGRQQLVAALRILQRGDISVDGMTGSWAGAMGHTQFIPTTYEAYAVDFDGDGRRDLWNSPPTRSPRPPTTCTRPAGCPGATWGYEVALPQNSTTRLAEDGKSRNDQRMEEARRRARARRGLSAARRQGAC